MFALFLNRMDTNTECSVCVAIADDEDKLKVWMDAEKVEPYQDEGFHPFSGNDKYKYTKCFRKGGLLEMFNSIEQSYSTNKGIIEVVGREDLVKANEDRLETWDYTFSSAILVEG